MSFIFDDKEFMNKVKELTRQAQSAPVYRDIDANQIKTVALKMISNLRSELSGVSVPKEAKLLDKNLLELPELLAWMRDNNIQYNGNVIVMPSQAPAQYVKNDYVLYGEEYVNVKGLQAFLLNLRQQASSSGNLYYIEKVAKLIEDANKISAFESGMESYQKKFQDYKAPKEQTPATTSPPVQDARNIQQMQQQKQDQRGQAIPASTRQVSETATKDETSAEVFNFILPFDTATGFLSLERMVHFIESLSELREYPQIAYQMQDISGALDEHRNQLIFYKEKYESIVPAGTIFHRGLWFDLSKDNTARASQLKEQLGYSVAINAMTIMSNAMDICSSMLLALRDVPYFQSQLGMLNSQYQYGTIAVQKLQESIQLMRIWLSNLPKSPVQSVPEEIANNPYRP